METLVKNKKKVKRKNNNSTPAIKTKKELLQSFFGKLPKIGDGLVYQKKVRNEW
jgi:hypothetical protein